MSYKKLIVVVSIVSFVGAFGGTLLLVFYDPSNPYGLIWRGVPLFVVILIVATSVLLHLWDTTFSKPFGDPVLFKSVFPRVMLTMLAGVLIVLVGMALGSYAAGNDVPVDEGRRFGLIAPIVLTIGVWLALTVRSHFSMDVFEGVEIDVWEELERHQFERDGSDEMRVELGIGECYVERDEKSFVTVSYDCEAKNAEKARNDGWLMFSVSRTLSSSLHRKGYSQIVEELEDGVVRLSVELPSRLMTDWAQSQ